MLIDSLGLKNFKCFEELDVKFAPITLLTGANSSGKSSLINAILAVLQTEQFPLYLSPNGKYAEMGGMKDIIFNNDLSNSISIDIEFDLYDGDRYFSFNFLRDNHFKTSWEINKKNELPKLRNMESISSNVQLLVHPVNNHVLVDIFNDEFGDYEENEEKYFVIHNEFKRILEQRKGKDISKKGEYIKIADLKYKSIEDLAAQINSTSSGYYFEQEIVDKVFRYTSFVDKQFNYIGSFRKPPLRTYYQKAKSQRKVNSDGEGYIDQLIEWQDTNEGKLNSLIQEVASLGLFDQIKPNRLRGGRFDLSVKVNKNSKWASLTDIGFGVSQFLPIIVADFQLDHNSCLAVSQPEIHLHPPIQAAFGNYLASQIKQNKKQYIIETHSEYLLNRIRLLLVTGELKPEDVRVLYFENDGTKSTVHDVEFTLKGAVKGAPQGFFDTYEMDVMDIAMQAIG